MDRNYLVYSITIGMDFLSVSAMLTEVHKAVRLRWLACPSISPVQSQSHHRCCVWPGAAIFLFQSSISIVLRPSISFDLCPNYKMWLIISSENPKPSPAHPGPAWPHCKQRKSMTGKGEMETSLRNGLLVSKAGKYQ